MRPIIKWTILARKLSIIWWCLGIAAFVILELSVYSSVKGQAAQLNQALRRLPGSVKSLFGANTDLFSPVGYLNSRLFYFLLPLLLSILTIGLGSSLLAREESEGTVELLLSRPVSRAKLVLAKLFGGLAVTLLITATSTVVIILSVKAVHLPVPLPEILFATFMALLMALLFGMIAFTITCIGGRGRGSAIGIACLFGLGSYIIASLESNVHWLKYPAKILPYHYYSPTAILSGTYTWLTASWMLAIILVLGVVSWLSFRQRDVGV